MLPLVLARAACTHPQVERAHIEDETDEIGSRRWREEPATRCAPTHRGGDARGARARLGGHVGVRQGGAGQGGVERSPWLGEAALGGATAAG